MADGIRSTGGEFLTFTLGGEEYGIDILKIQEIRGYDTVTPVAHAPAFVKGVTSLHGAIVPVVDMRIRFGLDRPEYGPFTVMIVLNLGGRMVGMVVDGVADLAAVAPGQMEPAPESGTVIDCRYLMGRANGCPHPLFLVDIEKLMLDPEMELTEETAA